MYKTIVLLGPREGIKRTKKEPVVVLGVYVSFVKTKPVVIGAVEENLIRKAITRAGARANIETQRMIKMTRVARAVGGANTETQKMRRTTKVVAAEKATETARVIKIHRTKRDLGAEVRVFGD